MVLAKSDLTNNCSTTPVHTHTHTHTHIHICVYSHLHMYTHTYTHMHTYTHSNIYTCTYISVQPKPELQRRQQSPQMLLRNLSLSLPNKILIQRSFCKSRGHPFHKVLPLTYLRQVKPSNSHPLGLFNLWKMCFSHLGTQVLRNPAYSQAQGLSF